MDESKTNLYLLKAYTKYATGCDTFMKELLKGMSRHGAFNLHVIVEDSPVQHITKERKDGLTYIYFPEIRQNKFAELEACMSEAVDKSPGMIFVSNFFPVIFNVKAVRKLFPHAKFVHIIHDLPWLAAFGGNENAYMDYIMGRGSNGMNDHDGKFVKYCTYDILESFDLSDRIVCLCQSTYRMLTDFYEIPTEKVRLIRNGVEDHAASGYRASRDCVMRKYNIPREGLLVMLVGRLTHSKGSDRIGKLLDMLSPDILYNVVYAGNDDVGKWLTETAYGPIINVGPRNQEEMQELYSVADLGLFPSRHEQCSYAGIEFLMNGIPVIYFPDYGVKDMFNSGFSFEYSTLHTITAGQIEAKKHAARNEYLRNYTAKEMLCRYVSLFKELASL